MQVIYEDDERLEKVPNIADAPARDVEQQIQRMELLVGVAFPAAPSAVISAITNALYANQAIGWASWALCHPDGDLDEGLPFAVNAYIRSCIARDAARSVYNDNNPDKGLIIGYAASDGLIAGTSNVSEDGKAYIHDLMHKQRLEIIEDLDGFEYALVKLAYPNSSAISVEGWLRFCKFLDSLMIDAAGLCSRGLQLLIEREKKNAN